MCPGKNDLFHVKLGNAGTQTVKTPSNIQAWGLHAPWKGAIAQCVTLGQHHASQEALTPRLTIAGSRMV
jgi:hypothetical protein